MAEEDKKEGKLGLAALTAMVVGSMVGAGIFMIPARFASATGVYGALIAWVIAGLGMLMLAFVFQSLAVRKPHLDAGVFSYAREGFGDYAGFVTAIGFWASACAGNVTYLVLIKSTLGVIFAAAKSGDLPKPVSRANDKGVPKIALLMSALLTQVILITTYFSEGALDFALDLTSALALLPFLLIAGYAVQIAFRKDGYDDVPGKARKRELIVGIIATVYTIFLIMVAGLQFIPLSCIILAPATILYYFARKGRSQRLFTNGEKILFAFLCVGFAVAIIGVAMGWIVL